MPNEILSLPFSPLIYQVSSMRTFLGFHDDQILASLWCIDDNWMWLRVERQFSPWFARIWMHERTMPFIFNSWIFVLVVFFEFGKHELNLVELGFCMLFIFKSQRSALLNIKIQRSFIFNSFLLINFRLVFPWLWHFSLGYNCYLWHSILTLIGFIFN